MKKIFTFLTCLLIGTFVMAQKPSAVVSQATVAPTIDGVAEAMWDAEEKNNIDKVFGAETPTVGESGTTYWKALWDKEAIYVLVVVNDNLFLPAYAGGTPGQNWMYDKPEIYFDVNYTLVDGGGAGGGKGHIQIAPGFTKDKINGEPLVDNTVTYAFKVTGSGYVGEYKIPFGRLLTAEGLEVDKMGTIGFDVTVIDTDAETTDTPPNGIRQRMVWANIGTVAESYSNMDDCGTITLDGATESIFVESITITGEGGATTITTDNGTLQLSAAILPEDATTKTVTWSIANGESDLGRARLTADGLLTALVDGNITVKAAAKDGSYVESTLTLTISNQKVTRDDINVLTNGDFNKLNTDGLTAASWGGWTDASPAHTVVDGVSVHTPVESANVWNYQFSQNALTAKPNIPYVFTFKAWAAVARTLNVDFEDIADNSNRRYGVSSDPGNVGGRSEWNFDVTTEPKWFTYNVLFDEIKENTDQKVCFMFGLTPATTVYVDSVYLYSTEDEALITSIPQTKQESFRIYPNPVSNELTVVLPTVNANLAIYNSVGQKVYEKVANSLEVKVDVSALPKGMYFVRVNNISTQKFVK